MISEKSSGGVSPDVFFVVSPLPIFPTTFATLIMKKSSKFVETMVRNRNRSASGISGCSESAKTRELKSIQPNSRST